MVKTQQPKAMGIHNRAVFLLIEKNTALPAICTYIVLLFASVRIDVFLFTVLAAVYFVDIVREKEYLV